MKLLFTFIAISLSGYSQNLNSVVIVPTTNAELDDSTSYLYCATMAIMWSELREFLEEEPKSSIKNASIEALNESVSGNYQAPIEDKYVVANSGLVKDSIIEKINVELDQKFKTYWNPSSDLDQEALVSYSHLKKDVNFLNELDANFEELPFFGHQHIKVDYFGVKEGDPNRRRKDLIIYDYRNSNDFIVQVKCLDSLDEVYFAKVPLNKTLTETYNAVMDRVNLDKMVYFSGSDILQIPYIKFDTIANYSDLEGAVLVNEVIDGKSFRSVEQRISFDLNPDGIRLESNAASMIDFADFESPPPRVLAFDKPFLIIMKRKNSDQPYFMFWVSGAEFMKSYILEWRKTEDHEKQLIGKWKIKEMIYSTGETKPFLGQESTYEFKSDGTFDCTRSGEYYGQGTWKYAENAILISLKKGGVGTEMKWILEEFTLSKFIVAGKTRVVYEKVDAETTH